MKDNQNLAILYFELNKNHAIKVQYVTLKKIILVHNTF